MKRTSKVKRAKLVKRQQVSAIDKEQIEAIYKLRPLYVNGTYFTPIMQDKSTVVRITFAEFNHTLMKNIPVTAILMSIEDVQTTYNAMTELLQNMRQLGRIA